jgi:hypothetical protein
MISSDFDILLAGKKKFNPVWQLQVVVEPMLSIDYVLSPGVLFSIFEQKIANAEQLTFEILYDGVVLGKTNFPDNKKQEFAIEINDTIKFETHLLEFKMSGKEDIHSCFSDKGESVTWIIKYDFFIEDLPMEMLLYRMSETSENCVTLSLGQNETESVVLETPVYGWLVKNSSSIFRDLQRTNTNLKSSAN